MCKAAVIPEFSEHTDELKGSVIRDGHLSHSHCDPVWSGWDLPNRQEECGYYITE